MASINIELLDIFDVEAYKIAITDDSFGFHNFR